MRFLAALLFLVPSVGLALTVKSDCSLTWDYVEPLPSNVDGFRLFVDGTPIWRGTERVVSCVDLGIGVGAHEAYVVAYNAAGESMPSNTLTFLVVDSGPVEAPVLLRFVE